MDEFRDHNDLQLYVNDHGVLVIPDYVHNSLHFVEGVALEYAWHDPKPDTLFFYSELELFLDEWFMNGFKTRLL